MESQPALDFAGDPIAVPAVAAFVPWPHQERSIELLREGFRKGHRCQLLMLPTAGGKTLTSSLMVKATSDKHKRSAFLADRIALIDQTSRAYSRLDIDHGIIQADHWRYRPQELAQIASIQTIIRRGLPSNLDIIFWDECHAKSAAIEKYIRDNQFVKVVGLSATPFTDCLNLTFTNLICPITGRELVEQGHLCPLKTYIAVAADLRGVKFNSKGEWDEAEVGKKSLQIIGDITGEWTKQTYAHFGGPQKTMVFSPDVAYGTELCRSFNELGHNFVQVSYKTPKAEAEEIMKEFAKPWGETTITGLISVEKLAKGYDQPDVLIGVDARPLRKSLSGYIQKRGRVMRAFPGKTFGLWICHSGNVERFGREELEIFNHGLKDLSDDTLDKKIRKNPTKKEKEAMACHRCKFMFFGKSCPACGWERPQKPSAIENVPGTVSEYSAKMVQKVGPAWMDDRAQVWKEICGLAIRRKNGDMELAAKFANAQYKNMYKEWPTKRFDNTTPLAPSSQVEGKVRSQLIAWAKSKR